MPEDILEGLAANLRAGMEIKATTLSKEFDFRKFQERHSEKALLLFLIDEKRRLTCATVDHPPKPRAGHTLISLAPA